jgi:hypothetical protein
MLKSLTQLKPVHWSLHCCLSEEKLKLGEKYYMKTWNGSYWDDYAKFRLKLRIWLWFVVWQKVVQELQLWRLLTSPCVFSSTPEILFGLYLVYFFRVFERQIGSNKYLVRLFQITLHPCTLHVQDEATWMRVSNSVQWLIKNAVQTLLAQLCMKPC